MYRTNTPTYFVRFSPVLAAQMSHPSECQWSVWIYVFMCIFLKELFSLGNLWKHQEDLFFLNERRDTVKGMSEEFLDSSPSSATFKCMNLDKLLNLLVPQFSKNKTYLTQYYEMRERILRALLVMQLSTWWRNRFFSVSLFFKVLTLYLKTFLKMCSTGQISQDMPNKRGTTTPWLPF